MRQVACIYWLSKKLKLNSHSASDGYLLPVVISLGLGISVAVMIVLQVLAQNNLTLNSQYYTTLANEAAQAGVAAATACIKANTPTWTTLTPALNCDGTPNANQYVANDGNVTSSYTVSALQNSYSNATRIINSVGTVKAATGLGGTIQVASKTVRAFGDYNSITPTAVTAISAGVYHSCGVANGQAYCWGYNFNGQLGNNSLAQSNTPAAVDTNASDGSALNGKIVTDISAGEWHSCAVANGQAYCWGFNSNGQLGNNSTTQQQVPIAVFSGAGGALNGKTVTAITNKYDTTCAIANGQAYCWGWNGYGQLGNGTYGSSAESHVPVAVTGLSGKTVTAISTNGYTTCAIANGQAYCWGWNGASGVGYGVLGNGSGNNAFSPTPVAVDTSGVLNGKTVTGISVAGGFYSGGLYANFHACAVADSKPYCWGDNTNGTSGTGNNTNSTTPVAVISSGTPMSGKTVTAISTDQLHTCAIADTQAYCWGKNIQNELGDGTATDSNLPVAVNTTGSFGGQAVTAISTSNNASACAIANGSSYCWGYNYNGQQGNGTTSNASTPATVSTIGLGSNAAITAVSNGNSSIFNFGTTCAVVNGKAYCWGNGTYGQLGNGTLTSSSVPVAVDTSGALNGKTITAVSATTLGACALANGKVYCWGANLYGELGNGTTSYSASPVAVDTSGVLNGKTVTAISTGYGFACAIANGQAYCWGSGPDGELGNGTTGNAYTPSAVSTSGVLNGKVITAISSGAGTSCVIASGQPYCWGINVYGELGNGSGSDSSIPVAVYTGGVLNGQTVTSINAEVSSCAIANGQAYCWGYNANGELGNNSNTNSSIPVAVYTGGALNGQKLTSIGSAGFHTSCAVGNGAAYCWGRNFYGGLGNHSNTNSLVPVAVDTSGALNGRAVTSISSTLAHSCAIANGQAYCWGYNASGQLGNNSTTDSNFPVGVNTLSNYPNTYSFTNGLVF